MAKNISYIAILDRCYILDRCIIGMRMIKECKHCGREFQDLSDAFCSEECAKEAS